ncbi:MAG: hypothetical protein E6G94_07585, partial [Alphaproteobacteria bacterium]
MQVRDGLPGQIGEDVAALHLGAGLVRIEGDVQHRMGDARLRDLLIFEEALLVIGGILLPGVAGAVFIEDIGVVEDPAPDQHRRERGGAGDQAGAALESGGEALKARLQPRLGPAPPEEVGGDEQKHRDRAPIGMEPPGALPVGAGAVHVRIDDLRRLGVDVEAVLQPDIAGDDGQDQVQDHDPPAGIFVGAERLDEDRQRREQDHVERRRKDVPEEIFAELVVRIALKRLDEQRGDHADQDAGDEHQRHRKGLGDDVGPIGQRSRVDDLVDLAVALPPDQLAAIINGDDQRDDREASREDRDHSPSHRVGRGAVQASPQPQADDGVDQADSDQHEIGRALEHLPRLEAGPGPELGAGRAGAEGGAGERARRGGRVEAVGGGDCGLCGVAALAAAARLAGAAVGEAVEAVGEREERDPDSDPDQPILEQDSPERRQLAVAL